MIHEKLKQNLWEGIDWMDENVVPVTDSVKGEANRNMETAILSTLAFKNSNTTK